MTTATSRLGVPHLHRLWARTAASRAGKSPGPNLEWHLDQVVIHGLGVGLEQAVPFLIKENPGFDAFEQWIIATAGEPSPDQVARINAAVAGAPCPEATERRLASVDAMDPVLSPEDLARWDSEGVVILHDAAPPGAVKAAEEALWEHLGADPRDPESWYGVRANGIMVQLFQHPALEAVRRSPRIHKAFAQLWGTADLWPTTDRCGFNVPERPGAAFPGPHLHWDVSLHQPIPFGTQGILYLTDTPPEQGALTVVPGFQHRAAAWLQGLPQGADPRMQDLHALGSRPIGGRAGDLVIWHQALPHGSRPNRGARPRLVQYLNFFRLRNEPPAPWI
ncbi:MAG TPA: phytanoyl-CoA dioxygenase family protein [Holophagaceae bacterium]|nr:phytanoyl-CoA dioxygenase family protein [Holophagaceae bacterium]